MGLFDRLRGKQELNLQPRAGLLLAALTMVAIDGDIDDDEVAIIKRIDGGSVTPAWEQAVQAWKLKSPQDCVQLAAGAMNAEQRLCAMANLIDIAMADGVLADAESTLLQAYVQAFQIPEDDVAKIVEIIALKNNKDVFQ